MTPDTMPWPFAVIGAIVLIALYFGYPTIERLIHGRTKK
jgi:hypothetical protein